MRDERLPIVLDHAESSNTRGAALGSLNECHASTRLRGLYNISKGITHRRSVQRELFLERVLERAAMRAAVDHEFQHPFDSEEHSSSPGLATQAHPFASYHQRTIGVIRIRSRDPPQQKHTQPAAGTLHIVACQPHSNSAALIEVACRTGLAWSTGGT